MCPFTWDGTESLLHVRAFSWSHRTLCPGCFPQCTHFLPGAVITMVYTNFPVVQEISRLPRDPPCNQVDLSHQIKGTALLMIFLPRWITSLQATWPYSGGSQSSVCTRVTWKTPQSTDLQAPHQSVCFKRFEVEPGMCISKKCPHASGAAYPGSTLWEPSQSVSLYLFPSLPLLWFRDSAWGIRQ